MIHIHFMMNSDFFPLCSWPRGDFHPLSVSGRPGMTLDALTSIVFLDALIAYILAK